MRIHSSVFALAATLLVAAPVAGQSRGVGPRAVPPGHLPPPGLCRIWIDGVPPGRQPRATDCRIAERNRPRNARVIYGDDWTRDRNGRVIARRNDRRDDRWDRRTDPRDARIDRRRDDRDDRDDRRRADVRDRNDEWCRDANRDGRCDSALIRRRMP